MHFKIAVILCALYFVTVTQSMGLNEEHIETIVDVFRKYKNRIDLITLELCTLMRKESDSYLKCKKGRTNAQKVQDLLVYLASIDTKFDNWKLPSLSSYEVKVYVSLFNKFDIWFDHTGLLDFQEVNKIVDALNLEEDVKTNLVDALKDSFEDALQLILSDETINSPTFLNAFLEVKPKGRGLDKKQVQQLINLHKNHKIDGDHIDPVEITKFFQKLSIVKKEHEGHLVFDSIRTAAFQLQELLVVSSEYNKEANEEAGIVYSTDSVRDILWDFSCNDVDKNGLLSKQEIRGIKKCHYENDDVDSIFKEIDTDDDKQLNIAEFFMLIFVEHERTNTEKVEHEQNIAEKAEHKQMTLRRRIVNKERDIIIS